jgi:DNA-binding response OmpR family regulator
MLTARTLERHQKQGIEVGADAYMTKPFQYEVVLVKVKELLGEQVI